MSAARTALVRPFAIDIGQGALDDLRRRLVATRWPERETVDDWSQGVPLAYLRDVVEYWLRSYDWREREVRLNAFPQCLVHVGGLDIHCLHVRSAHPHARALVMTHGWPGSFIEFLGVIGPLTAPEAHGGDVRDAFHVVCPSLPGYGFSAKPAKRGCGVETIAGLWDELMQVLGYGEYLAHGEDWGSAVTTQLGVDDRGHCRGIHVTMPIAPPPPEALSNPTDEDRRALAVRSEFAAGEAGYSAIQSTRPQTLGYALADSPVGQCAWILEKFRAWTDCGGHPENAVSRDVLLDHVMLYWLTASGASSARLYWESFRSSFGGRPAPVDLPSGCSVFAKELSRPPRSWAERRYRRLVYWNEPARGGHFAALEQPGQLVHELRECFRLMH